jgi:DNA-binding NtrC family response regulator
MPQDYPGEYVGQYLGESLGQYFGEDPVHAQNIAPDAPPLTPHEIVPMLIGSTVEAIERELVLQTLARCDGNRTRAARVLGLSVRTMRNKIRQYGTDGLDVPAHS